MIAETMHLYKCKKKAKLEILIELISMPVMITDIHYRSIARETILYVDRSYTEHHTHVLHKF